MRPTLALLLVFLAGPVLAQDLPSPKQINVTLTKSQSAGSGSEGGKGTTQDYALNQGGAIRIRNVSGDITIAGYDGSTVQVKVVKTGRDQDLVEVEDSSSSSALDLKVKYRCTNYCDAGLNFYVKVPRRLAVELDNISNASGDITIEDFVGVVRVRSASGNVRLRDVEGSLDASTASGDVQLINVIGTDIKGQSASGNVQAQLFQISPGASLRFNSASGDVRVAAPSLLDAQVTLSSTTGEVRTNFPLTVQTDRYTSGQQARGTLGKGGSTLRATTATGTVFLQPGN